MNNNQAILEAESQACGRSESILKFHDYLLHTNIQSKEIPLEFPLPQEEKQLRRGLPSFLEFFAGSGLVAEGLKSYFKVAWANDISEKKATVYRANHCNGKFVLGSIADISGKDLPKAPLAWASFPCQDLSLAGLAKGIFAERSGLVWEWLRVMDEMSERPPILVAENVAGLISVDNGAHYRELHKALRDRGYLCGAMLLDAALWIPQSRPRIFIVAVDSSKRIPESLVQRAPSWLHGGSVKRVVEGLDGNIWWNLPEPPPREIELADIVEWDAPLGSESSDSRNISLIAPKHKESLNSLPKNKCIVVPGYKRTRNGSQVLELRFDGIAGCLRTPRGGSSRQVLVFKKGDTLHSRLLTVRETARLMGAPENYNLPGNYNDGYMAMGDAVAVPVVKWLAKYLLSPLVKANA